MHHRPPKNKIEDKKEQPTTKSVLFTRITCILRNINEISAHIWEETEMANHLEMGKSHIKSCHEV